MQRCFHRSSCRSTGKNSHRQTFSKTRRRVGAAVELLEARWYLAGDPIVTVDTNFGNFQIELRPDAAPKTVANFLQYVDSGAYIDTIFHRSVPGFVEQTGGFTSASATFTSPSQFTAIPTNAPVPLEYDLPNITGSVAMARISDQPNSATDEWFVNMADNSQALAPGGDDPYGYAVFGQVIGNGMQVLNAIAALPIDNADNGTFSQLPLGPNNELVRINSVTVVDSIDGTVFSDVNGNGQLDAGEHGVAGRTVFLNIDGAGVPDSNNPSTTTDANGHFTFSGLAPGSYEVMEVLPSGVTLTTPLQTVTVAADETATANFGERVENGPGALAFSTATYNANETDPYATITLTRTGGSSGAVSVTVGETGDTAMDGTDYSFVEQTVTWGDGDAANKAVNIPLIDDNLSGETSPQILNLYLFNQTGGATIGTQGTAALDIAEDYDQPFSGPVYLQGQPGDGSGATFVHNLYRELLGREPDAAGQAYWASLYNQLLGTGSAVPGAPSAQQTLVADFLDSPEYRARLVEGIYMNFLHRTADTEDLAFWTSELAAGVDEKSMLAGILGSQEYFTDAQSGALPFDIMDPTGEAVAAWVSTLYRDLLGRPADAGGLAFWTQLASTQDTASGRSAIAFQFLGAGEVEQKLLNGNYPGAAGSVGSASSPGSPVVGAYALAEITGNGWDNLYFQGHLSADVLDTLFAQLQAGAYYGPTIAGMVDLQQYLGEG